MKSLQPTSEAIYIKHILILLVITLLVWGNTLSNGFAYDDTVTIANNQFIREWGNIPKLLSKDYFNLSGELTYRPLVTLTYFLDYSLWGMKPSKYHLTNLIIHASNVIFLYLFIILLLGNVKIAFLSALLFDVHPVQAEAVNAISFREDLLTVFFLLPSFILFIRLFVDFKSGYIRRLFYSVSLSLYALALFSKEMAITYPLFLIGYIYSFHSEKVRERIGYFISLIGGYVIVTLIYLLIYLGPLGNSNSREFPYTIPDLPIRLLTLPMVIVRYFLLFIFPYNLNADYIPDFNSSLIEPSLIISLIIISGIGAAAILLSRKDRRAIYGMFWFFISLMPVMNIVPIAYVIAERYLYLPLIGLSFFTSIFLITTYNGMPGYIKIGGLSALGIIVILLSIRSVYRNIDWKDDMILWSKTIITSPNSFMAHNNLGIAYANHGNLNEAIKEYKTAIRLKPDYLNGYNNLGIAYASHGNLNEAVKEYKTAIRLKPDDPLPYYNLGNAYGKQGRWQEAIEAYKTSLSLKPDSADTHYKLGLVYFLQEHYQEAFLEWNTVISITPDHVSAKNGLEILKKKTEQTP
ncbi:MAG: tetratricopeptide repeat protein [Nitrospinae bacterium]|nr:tetratricopeptide repeat protein [Nitrospinota bacterium]